MKKILLIVLVLFVIGCSKDDENQCVSDEILVEYFKELIVPSENFEQANGKLQAYLENDCSYSNNRWLDNNCQQRLNYLKDRFENLIVEFQENGSVSLNGDIIFDEWEILVWYNASAEKILNDCWL